MDIECQCQSTFICVVCDEQLVSGPAMVIFQPSTRDTQFQSAGSCVEGLGYAERRCSDRNVIFSRICFIRMTNRLSHVSLTCQHGGNV